MSGLPAGRTPSRTAFVEAAKSWDAAAIRDMLARDGSLATARDAKDRTALHVSAGAAAADRGRPSASVATARELLRGGAELDAVQEIADDGEVFRATPLW